MSDIDDNQLVREMEIIDIKNHENRELKKKGKKVEKNSKQELEEEINNLFNLDVNDSRLKVRDEDSDDNKITQDEQIFKYFSDKHQQSSHDNNIILSNPNQLINENYPNIHNTHYTNNTKDDDIINSYLQNKQNYIPVKSKTQNNIPIRLNNNIIYPRFPNNVMNNQVYQQNQINNNNPSYYHYNNLNNFNNNFNNYGMNINQQNNYQKQNLNNVNLNFQPQLFPPPDYNNLSYFNNSPNFIGNPVYVDPYLQHNNFNTNPQFNNLQQVPNINMSNMNPNLLNYHNNLRMNSLNNVPTKLTFPENISKENFGLTFSSQTSLSRNKIDKSESIYIKADITCNDKDKEQEKKIFEKSKYMKVANSNNTLKSRKSKKSKPSNGRNSENVSPNSKLIEKTSKEKRIDAIINDNEFVPNLNKPYKEDKCKSDFALEYKKVAYSTNDISYRIKSNNNYDQSNLDSTLKPKKDIFALQEFFNGFTSRSELISYICTPKGCRHIQSFLVKANSEILELIVDKIKLDLSVIMKNPYANYFFQKLSICLNYELRVLILNNLAKDFFSIASDNCGTHALQSLFEVVNTDLEIGLLLEIIKPDFLSICKVRIFLFYNFNLNK